MTDIYSRVVKYTLKLFQKLIILVIIFCLCLFLSMISPILPYIIFAGILTVFIVVRKFSKEKKRINKFYIFALAIVVVFAGMTFIVLNINEVSLCYGPYYGRKYNKSKNDLILLDGIEYDKGMIKHGKIENSDNSILLYINEKGVVIWAIELFTEKNNNTYIVNLTSIKMGILRDKIVFSAYTNMGFTLGHFYVWKFNNNSFQKCYVSKCIM